MLVNVSAPILLVGAGTIGPDDLDLAQIRPARLVAADGGARHLLRAGLRPDAVIGDLDSVSPEELSSLSGNQVYRIAEQETTDFDKCLRSIAAPLIVAVGFAGPRLDHALAVYNALVRHAAKRVIVVGAVDIAFHAPRRIAMDLEAGTRLSLFPLAEVTGRSDGLRWPIDGIEFSPWGRIGTSNEATGRVTLEFEGDGMLVVLPRTALDAAARALLA